MNLADTIVAVSSPAGAGERAILRLSGARAIEIADRVFTPACGRGLVNGAASRGLVDQPTYTALAGHLAPAGAGMAVPATLYLMKAPRSYTREDVAEFHVGAWPAAVPPLVAGLVEAGARPAEPGEFTFRAFVAGRLDLAQAEAVMGVVDASGEAALRAAGDLLAGHLSRECSPLIDAVRDVLALVEADLDFSDQDIELAAPQEVAARIDEVRCTLVDLGRRSRGLETFGGEVRLVLAGLPNVGKSSLFNSLLEADRAIISPVPGTTRDELRSALHIGGLEFVLSDVAGLDELASREGAATPACRRGLPNGAEGDDLASKARAKALEAIGRADLVLLALDATAASYDRMEEILGLVAVPMVVAITKCDLAPPDRATAHLAARGVAADVVATSAVTGYGLDDLRAALVRAVEGGAVDRESAGPVVTARHRSALERAAAALARAHRVARRGGAGELAALELREALEALGTVAGRKADGDVLDAIFSKFCIGK